MSELWLVVLDDGGEFKAAVYYTAEDARRKASLWWKAHIWHYVSDENGRQVQEWVEPEPLYMAMDALARPSSLKTRLRMSEAIMEGDVGPVAAVYEYFPGKHMRLLADVEVAELRGQS